MSYRKQSIRQICYHLVSVMLLSWVSLATDKTEYSIQSTYNTRILYTWLYAHLAFHYTCCICNLSNSVYGLQQDTKILRVKHANHVIYSSHTTIVIHERILTTLVISEEATQIISTKMRTPRPASNRCVLVALTIFIIATAVANISNRIHISESVT